MAADKSTVPLCVDLDGTVIKTDMLWESMIRLLRRNPLFAARVPLWFLRGRAFLKAEIAKRTDVDVQSLPLCESFVAYLRNEELARRPILLVTASDQKLADSVSDHIGLFNETLASNGKLNLRGSAKAQSLADRFGEQGFDYAGNSSVDLPVWQRARASYVVNARPALAKAAAQSSRVAKVFEPSHPISTALLKALRPHQWVKNLIVLVPLLTAHKLAEGSFLTSALMAIVAFVLCASGVYLVNDLVDLDADRHNPAKRHRPLAAGDLPISIALLTAPVLLLGGLVLGFNIATGLGLVLALYVLLALFYSWKLKQFALLDVFCLAALYTLRLVGGHEATGIKYSAWLLIFSMFIFVSLALLKRYVEVNATRARNGTSIRGRGYSASDAGLVSMLGTASGYLAVLVLALYVNSVDVGLLYKRPMLLLLICPLFLLWVSRMWLLAHRSQMHDDPVVFALKDWVSYLVGALTLAVVWAAT